jgi:hypothetical protein
VSVAVIVEEPFVAANVIAPAGVVSLIGVMSKYAPPYMM